MDPVGILLVDFKDLPHPAVLTVGGVGASILPPEAVLDDPPPCSFRIKHELLGAGDEDDVSRTELRITRFEAGS
jgi:hypothetical protein